MFSVWAIDAVRLLHSWVELSRRALCAQLALCNPIIRNEHKTQKSEINGKTDTSTLMRCHCYHRLANAVKPMPTDPIVASNFKLVGNWFFQHAQIDLLITNSVYQQFNSNKSKIIPVFRISSKRNFMVATIPFACHQCLLNGCSLAVDELALEFYTLSVWKCSSSHWISHTPWTFTYFEDIVRSMRILFIKKNTFISSSLVGRYIVLSMELKWKALNLKLQFAVDKSDCVVCIGFHFVWLDWVC